MKSNLFTLIICQGGGGANYCYYISFIQKNILLLPYVYVFKKTFYKKNKQVFLFIWYAIKWAQWCCFRYIFTKMKLRNSWLSFKAYIAFCNMITHRIATSCWLVSESWGYNGYFKHSDHLLLIKLWHTRQSKTAWFV